MNTTHELSSQEMARADVYLRLAEAFRLPGDGLSFVIGDLEAALRKVGSEAAEDAARLNDACISMKDQRRLGIDYTRLFLGPFLAAAPPYGSVYLDGDRRLMGDSTMDARRQYLNLGIDLARDFREPPDHISAELEFMAVLIRQCVEAIEGSEVRLVSEIVTRQRLFLEKHLGAWVPPFTEKMIAHAKTPFYRHLGELTRRFILEERNLISELFQQEDCSEA